ncbi:MAG: glycine cleavage system aminomethyltransferase GcvT [Ilumatobacteraceae bacterium]|nr:glycine cleavage system aminomethyltransferase GcvT [Ilumatobacteraceae bacterium]
MKTSPLDAQHRALGATMAEFGGWEMPMAYPSGTIAEHMACRGSAAMFDVSHLGTVRVEGAGSFDRLQRTLSNDLGKVAPGRAQYTHLLDADDASVVDDIIVWWHPGDDERFDVMPNASNTENVVDALGGADTTAERAVIAVQGPVSVAIADRVVPGIADVGRFRVGAVDCGGAQCTVAGTGYTGERGVEIAVPVDQAAPLWEALADAGAVPAGLGARDTLRLEAALPLHGHELGPGITPLQAHLSWVVGWDKPEFTGRKPLLAERERGVARHLVGISTEGRRPPRAGDIWHDDRQVGVVTSGNFSPVLGHGIALGFVAPTVDVGAEVEIDVRGKRISGVVASTPFVTR